MTPVLPDSFLRRMDPSDRRPLGKAGLTAAECQLVAEAKSEKELQRQVSNYLTMRGIFAVRSGMHKATSLVPGTPDFIFSVRRKGQGVPVAVECKTSTGKLSPEQEWVREQLLRDGWVYAVVRELCELQDLLRHLEESE